MLVSPFGTILKKVSRIIGLSDKQKVTHTINSKEFKGFDFLPYIPKADESI